jgi:uncharacterized membrane protein
MAAIFFLNQPFGRWLLMLLGLTVIGVGIAFLYQAYKAKFRPLWQTLDIMLPTNNSNPANC